MIKRRIPEAAVLRACLDLLKAKRIWCERRNSGVMESASGKGRWVKFGEKGMADIQALLNVGMLPWNVPESYARLVRTPELDPDLVVQKVLWIECKASDGKQSYDQKLFQHIVEAEGHSYLLVSDVDTLAEWLKERGL